MNMIISSKYEVTVQSENDRSVTLTVIDENPQGVTLIIAKDMEGVSEPLNLPRRAMIEALEYITKKLKAGSE